jgi:hypothetical protein
MCAEHPMPLFRSSACQRAPAAPMHRKAGRGMYRAPTVNRKLISRGMKGGCTMEMALAFGWFTPRTYSHLREISADKDNLPETFQEWETLAQAQFDGFRQKGIAVEKVLIDPDALLKWANEAPINSKKRAEFAAMVLMKKHESSH